MNGSPAVKAYNRRPASGLIHINGHSSSLFSALERTRRCLLSRQAVDGHWVGELEGDTILESEYILLMAFLGREREERVALAKLGVIKPPTKGRTRPWNEYPAFSVRF